MKKNIFILFFLLSVSSIQGQLQDFEGIWISTQTTFLVTFIISEDLNSVKALSYSFDSDSKITELVSSFDDVSISTKSENEANGYKIDVTYTLINKNLLQAKITGDGTSDIKYVRLY